jgi:4'-phosphopantetheinyl transferase
MRRHAPSPLSHSEAHIWYARSDGRFDASALRYQASFLGSDEIERMRQYRFEHDQRQYLMSHALVRATLSHYTSVAPRDWRFRANYWGRPEIERPAEFRRLRFNLSHTRGLVAVAIVWDRAVGVDVEIRDRAEECWEVAERYFSRTEWAALSALPRERQPERFLEYWTLKEAYVKARGMGLSLPLDQFSFVLRPGHPVQIVFDARMGDNPLAWQFGQFRPTASHLLAYAIGREQITDIAVKTIEVPSIEELELNNVALSCDIV